MKWQPSCWINRPGKLIVALVLTAKALPFVAQGAEGVSADPRLKELLRAAIDETDSFPDRFEAQVWLTDMSARLQPLLKDPDERVEILKKTHRWAQRHQLPPELVLAVIEVESGFDRFAVSSAGARGLMQVMPFWLVELDRTDENLFHLDTNLSMGCTILRYYLDMEDGDLVRGLARYNGSTGRRIYSDKVLDRLRTRWFRQ